jgi:hypothetical protein
MTLLDAIHRAAVVYRARFNCSVDDLRLLVHPEAMHELFSGESHSEVFKYLSYDGLHEEPKLMGIKLIEPSAVEGWEVVFHANERDW